MAPQPDVHNARRAEALEPHSPNAFGLLRLVLASLVIVQHSLILTGHPAEVWIGSLELFQRATYGDVAVAGFFAVSGYLLAGSVHRHRPTRFLRLRFFRLFPGFWVALLMVAFVVAPAIAWVADRQGSYAVVGPDSAMTYVVQNAALVIFQPSIGTVLEGNPYPNGLDGSFWTLAPEFLCYLGLLVLAIVAARFRARSWFLPVATAGVLWLAFVAGGVVLGERGLVLSQVASLGTAFFVGASISVLGWARDMTWQRVATAGVLLALALAMGLWNPFGPILLALSVVGLGSVIRTGPLATVGTRNDISYGVYLYHFPIIQLLVAGGLATNLPWVAGTALSVLVWASTLPVAWLSWLLVESPSQRFAHSRTRQR